MSDEEHYRMGWLAKDYTLIGKYYTHPYAAISPTLPALSAVGKNILVTGGGFGIGLSIVNAFASAGASRITIVGRNRSTLESAEVKIETCVPTTEIAVFPASLTDQNAIRDMFAAERAAHREYDIVVLCAGFMHVGASLFDVTDEQYLKVPLTVLKPKTIVDISSTIVQDRSPIFGLYHLKKSTFTNFIHQLDLELGDTGLKTFSIHPGLIFTGMATRVGVKETDLPFDHPDLPGHFTVWVTSPEAAFLKGRYVWAAWDVDELKTKQAAIEAHSKMLQLGLVTRPYVCLS